MLTGVFWQYCQQCHAVKAFPVYSQVVPTWTREVHRAYSCVYQFFTWPYSIKIMMPKVVAHKKSGKLCFKLLTFLGDHLDREWQGMDGFLGIDISQGYWLQYTENTVSHQTPAFLCWAVCVFVSLSPLFQAWNPAAEDQCVDRCHRLGQKRDVVITKVIYRHTMSKPLVFTTFTSTLVFKQLHNKASLDFENIWVVVLFSVLSVPFWMTVFSFFWKFIVKDSVEENMVKIQKKKQDLVEKAFGARTGQEKRQSRIEEIRALMELWFLGRNSDWSTDMKGHEQHQIFPCC